MSYLGTIIRKAGTLVGRRKAINFIEGSNVTLTVTDDNANNRVNVTVAASVTGSGVNDGDYGDIIVSSSGTQWDIDTTIDLSVNSVTTTTSVEATTQVITPTVKASTSAGVAIHNASSADCALFGAGGGQNVTFYDGVKMDASTASRILSTDASKNITALDTATYPSLTELSYVKGVTSAIQTQLNAKQNIQNIPLVSMVSSQDETITAGYGAVIPSEYTVSSGNRLTIGLNSKFKVI